MANADMCLDAARKAFPTNEKMRVAYMIGFNEGFDRATEQPEVDLEKTIDTFFEGWEDCLDYGHALNSEGECVSTKEIVDIARHFYELGKARKEE